MDALGYLLIFVVGVALGLCGPALWVRLRVRADIAPSPGKAVLLDALGREVSTRTLPATARVISRPHGRGRPHTEYHYRGRRADGVMIYHEVPRRGE